MTAVGDRRVQAPPVNVADQPQTAARVLTSVGRSWPSAVSHLI